MRIIIALAISSVAVSMLAGCQYKAEPLKVNAYNIYSSYEGKLPGKYLAYVDSAALNKIIKPADINCAAHSFPLDLASGFDGSVKQTFANLVDQIEFVPEPVSREQLADRGARGMIIIKGEDLQGRLRVVPGFWTVNIETDVEISASITVDGKAGRLLGSTVSGRGTFQGDAGAFCAGGAASLTQSAELAMKDVLNRLGEALNNSDRVHTGR